MECKNESKIVQDIAGIVIYMIDELLYINMHCLAYVEMRFVGNILEQASRSGDL